MKSLEDINCTFPSSLNEALTLLADEKTRGRLLAGGTDLMVQWASSLSPIPERVISVFGLPELCGITETEQDVLVGAAVTHADLRNSPVVRKYLPALAAAAATIGGTQIQVRGTIAGNVANASPAGDLAPALLVTDGFVVLASVSGERLVELTRFFLGYRKVDLRPDELIVRFVLPKLPKGARESFRKLGPRAAQAISKVMGSCRCRLEFGIVRQCAISIGSVAPVPVRLWELERWLAGKKLDEEVISEAEKRAAATVKPIDDIRSTAEYRQWVSGRLVRGFLEDMTSQ